MHLTWVKHSFRKQQKNKLIYKHMIHMHHSFKKHLGILTRYYRQTFDLLTHTDEGAQWLSGRVLDSRQRGRGFEPHRRHCIVVLEQDTFVLA